MLNGRRQPSLGRTSRVNREVYARFCERLAVRFRGPTRQVQRDCESLMEQKPQAEPYQRALADIHAISGKILRGLP